MSSKELSEWLIFYSIEPFGIEAQFLGHAITASTIANVNRGKGDKPYEPKQFMPKFEGSKEQTPDEMLQIAEMYTLGLGGRDLRSDAERSAMQELMQEDEDFNYG